jgi:Amt family ammonium transporter
VEKVRDGHPTTLGAPSGTIAALHVIGGGFELLGKQAVAILAVFAYAFTVTWLIARAPDLTMGIGVPAPTEAQGLDPALNAENAYENGEDKAHAPRGHAEQLHHLVTDTPVELDAEAPTR